VIFLKIKPNFLKKRKKKRSKSTQVNLLNSQSRNLRYENMIILQKYIYIYIYIHEAQSTINRILKDEYETKLILKIDITNDQSQHRLIFETCVLDYGLRLPNKRQS
jgi:hypothetical protein